MLSPSVSRSSILPPDGFARRVRRMKILGLLIAVAAMTAGFFLYRGLGSNSYRLRMSAGDALGHRHALAEVLAAEASKRRLTLDLLPTLGSAESLDDVASGRLDVALVQGGLAARPEVREVAVLVPEPLHLLARSEIVDGGLAALRGARLNLGTSGSGTRRLALQTLERTGLKPGDYHDERATYAELEQMSAAELPDAVFLVSSLPARFAEWIVSERGYRLMPLPFGESMVLRDTSLTDAVIPAYTYSVAPAVPAEAVHSVAPWMTIVAHRDIPDEAVIRLLEAVFDGDFALHGELADLAPEQVVRHREYPLHPGTTTYLNRNQPLITGEMIEGIENLRSFLVSGLVALFLAWRWYHSRASVGFERYLDDVTRIELELLELHRQGLLNGERALQLEQRLSQLKSSALEHFSSGKLRGDELLGSFLTHVADVRNCLHRLASSERPASDRLPAGAGHQRD
jgi:TRAP transporter TAXI family solute receptor